MEIDELHEKFVQYGKNAQEWKRKCLLLLPEIERHEVWKKKRFDSIYDYAAKLAGISYWQVSDALRIIKKIEDKPALMEVARKKGLNAVRIVATIATKRTADYWAKQALDMSKNELEVFVRDKRRQDSLEGSENKNLNSEENLKSLTIDLRGDLIEKLNKMSNGDWNSLMGKFIKLYEEELEKEKPETKEKSSRYIPEVIKKYILKRSSGKCEFSGCNKPYQHLHHADRYASAKSHDPDRIVALCAAHHNLAHRGLIKNESLNIKLWKIREEPVYTELNWFIDRHVAKTHW